MGEESWHAARLIPTSGIGGADEQERRATSALLAVMSAVREYGRAVTAPLGAPAGRIETFVEVPFTLAERKVIPDGLIRVTRGARSWTALVEVKTGANTLRPEQVGDYLDVAKEQAFDAVLTISNEVPPQPGVHPTKVDKRKLRKVALHHLAWTQVLSEAVMQKEHRGVADPDQAWILGELIRYLEHPRSGALEFEDMGPNWVSVRQAVTAGTLRAGDKGADEVAQRFDALIRYAALRLGRRLGTEVSPVLSRSEQADPSVRTHALVSELVAHGLLRGTMRVAGTVAPLVVVADLRAGHVACHVDIDAPRQGRPLTRVNWLVRQLKAAPDGLRVEAFVARAHTSAAELLATVRSDPGKLVLDPAKEIRAFRVTALSPLGVKRGAGKGAFIDSVLDAVDSFYTDVVQVLKAWSPAPPKLRPEPLDQEEVGDKSLPSTSLSSQDGAETASEPSHDLAGVPEL